MKVRHAKLTNMDMRRRIGSVSLIMVEASQSLFKVKRLSANKRLLEGEGSSYWGHHVGLGILGCQRGYESHF